MLKGLNDSKIKACLRGMKGECVSCHNGFAMLEALFCLFLTSFALVAFGYYLSIPKTPISPYDLIYPSKVVFENQVILQSKGLAFEATYQEIQAGEEVYFSFEVR